MINKDKSYENASKSIFRKKLKLRNKRITTQLD